MEAEARYTFVGAAVLVLVAGLVAALLWLHNTGGGDFRRYTINFEHQALDGLEVGAEVTLRGVKVGRVEDYALSQDSFNRVRVEVRVDRRAPVHANTEAVVTRNFVTGIAGVALVTREPPGPPLVDAPEGERFPVIAEGRSDLDEIAGRVNKVGDMAAAALNNINLLLTAENRQAMRDTVDSLRALADGLNQRLPALDRSLAQVGTAARDVGAAATRLGQVGDRIAGVVERDGDRLERTLGEAEGALIETRKALQQVTATTAAVQRQVEASAKRFEASAAGLDDQLGAALSELRLSVESASRVVERLRDPRAALFGPGPAQLGPGETRP
ncbi:MlaD family protein [uncultured Piscinibacter sp.]|uniref:MlaD family protein n=1 Tax=uncultured Piscinibacter sp. TaxID=1131835 RepID=UPI002604EABD|nr:MlaD family protein [uncultured Piscinibacter sp.]